MKRIRSVFISTWIAIAAGCVAPNPYINFYYDLTGGRGVTGNPDLIEPLGDPRIVQGTSVDQDNRRMREDGFVPVGYSSFNSSQATEWQALQQGRMVHADTVILYENYTETLSGMSPFALPRTETVNTEFSADGSGGTVQGNAVQTRTGYQTTYVPYHVRRYDFLASYWVKAKPRAFGAVLRDLTDSERQKIESNRGAAVELVLRGTPAFNSDILPGDILKRINEEDILDSQQAVSLFAQHRGETVHITIIRNGNTITKDVKLSP